MKRHLVALLAVCVISISGGPCFGQEPIPLIVGVAAGLPAASATFQTASNKNNDKQSPADESVFNEKLLRDAKIATDGPALLQYLRERTPKEVDSKHLELLIHQLGDKEFASREKAYKELLYLGPAAMGVINEATRHRDIEVRTRASELLRLISARTDASVQTAVARLIGHWKPDGATEVLLVYLPVAAALPAPADEIVVEEICRALTKVTVAASKVEPALVLALRDKEALKRAAGGAALAGFKEQSHQVRGLLKDPVPAVRLRVAQALVQSARDKDAVPVLIQCLLDSPAQQLPQ